MISTVLPVYVVDVNVAVLPAETDIVFPDVTKSKIFPVFPAVLSMTVKFSFLASSPKAPVPRKRIGLLALPDLASSVNTEPVNVLPR